MPFRFAPDSVIPVFIANDLEGICRSCGGTATGTISEKRHGNTAAGARRLGETAGTLLMDDTAIMEGLSHAREALKIGPNLVWALVPSH